MPKTTIKISKEVRDKLRQFKGFGRTYDQAIEELLASYEKEAEKG